MQRVLQVHMGHPRLLTHSFSEVSAWLRPALVPSAERPRRTPLVLATLKRKSSAQTHTE
jgi:hypothetical protein